MATLNSILKSGNIDQSKVIVLGDEEISWLQDALLEMLDDFISVCQKNKIEYYLGGGSALGAVRHRGFIPWDDDIDINIPRCEINRLIKAFNDEYFHKYWIHIPGKTQEYDYLMIKIISRNIKIRQIMDANRIEYGLCIDIFPIENTFDHKLMRYVHGIGSMIFRYLLSCIRFQRNKAELTEIMKNDKVIMKYVRKRCFIGKLVSVIPESSLEKAAQKWICMCKNQNSKYVVIPSGQHQFFKEMYERGRFCKSLLTEFEGRMVKITADYDNYLKVLYGEYMAVPPESKREKHIVMEFQKYR